MLKIIWYPLSLIYGLIISIRNFLYESKIFKQHEFNVPIISVGNITVGGTGKTPHAEYIVDILKDQFHIAFLSRGYKRKTKGFVKATLQSGPNEIGDEPVQIKQKFPLLNVAVCENRVKGINQLIAETEQAFDAIILDDAFQHRRVLPSINILLIDYNRPISDDSLLPLGRLREQPSARYRANMIIYTKCPPHLQPIEQRIIKNRLDIRPYQDLFFTTIVYGEITPAIQGARLFNDDMKRYQVLLITGIAYAKPLIEHLGSQVGEVIHRSFPDHHSFSENDIERLTVDFNAINSSNKIIITTEKDFSRIRFIEGIPELFMQNLYYIPIKVKFLDKTKEQFIKKIRNYVTENKSNSRLHKK